MSYEFKCWAVLTSEGMRCDRCRYLWSPANPNPPRCLTAAEVLDDPLKPVIQRMLASNQVASKS